MANDLHDIELDEVSLVDAGMNKGARILLFKREDPNMPDKDLQKQFDELKAKLDEVEAINKTVSDESDKMKVTLEKTQEDLAVAVKRAEEAEAEIDKGKDKNKDKDIDKGKLPENVVKALEERDTKITELTKRDEDREAGFQKMRDEQAEREIRATVAKFDKVPMDEDKVVDLFKRLSDDDRELVIGILTSTQGLVEKNMLLLKEVGGGGAQIPGSALEEATTLARELMKDNAKFKSLQAARAEVWTSRPELKKRYDDERKAQH